MATLSRYNIHPLNLDASIDASGGLSLAHSGDLLSDYDDSIFDELPEDGTGPNDDAEVVIADFTHNGSTHQVYAWEEVSTGLQQWARTSGAARSGARSDLDETDVLVIAVPPGVSVPTPTSTGGPPAPGTTQTTVKVKVRKQGSMPW